MALPQIDEPGELAPSQARSLTRIFLRRLGELEEGTEQFQYVRNTLIEMNQSLVRFAAGRFRPRSGAEPEDIFQVGVIGLIKAIDRFDLGREVEFTTFALPYIRGEIRRHFRDATWAVHVPRRLQELRVDLARAHEHLGAVLGREPAVAEMAEHLGIGEYEVAEAMTAANGYEAASLDGMTTAGDHEDPAGRPARGLADVWGEDDPGYELFENCHALGPLLRDLDTRERRILRMRFGDEMTQQQIGDTIGCSQMWVSRTLSAIFDKLRRGLLAEA